MLESKSFYRRGERSIAVLDTMPYYDLGVLITRLNVPEDMRGAGVAKDLLTEVCNEADFSSFDLWLEFSPYPGTNRSRLAKLYELFGFKDEGGLWLRKYEKDHPVQDAQGQ